MQKTIYAFDCETHLISYAQRAPRLVCLSVYGSDGEHRLYRKSLARRRWLEMLEAAANGDAVLVGHNTAYDVGVLCNAFPESLGLAFAAYEADGFADTQIRAKLLDIAAGKTKKGRRYNLAACADRALGIKVTKGEDTWRLRYAELEDVPLSEWPEEARQYALDDTRITYDLFIAQESIQEAFFLGISKKAAERAAKAPSWLDDQFRQTRADWPLHLIGAWGIHADQERLDEVRAFFQGRHEECRTTLIEHGLVEHTIKKGADKYTLKQQPVRDLVIEVCKACKVEPEKTKKGGISADKDWLKILSVKAGDHPKAPLLLMRSEYVSTQKFLNTYVEAYTAKNPLARVKLVQPSFNVLVETGRTSCYDPNMQNLPQEGGLREVFIPRPGHYFVSVDYDSAEMRTLGQAMLDLGMRSPLAEFFQNDPKGDGHTYFAASMIGVSYEEGLAMRKAGDKSLPRKYAKAANFGLPGGMGIARFIDHNVKKAGILFSPKEARELKRKYVDQWNVGEFFAYVSNKTAGGPARFTLPRSNRTRTAGYSDGCNYHFQGPAADGAKRALFNLAKDMYLARRGDPLYGCRMVNFIHDEVIAEVPIKTSHEAANTIASIMIEGLQHYCPDVPITAEPALMRRWYKDADPVYKAGQLVPWEP